MALPPSGQFTTQIASDIHRDGLGVELLSSSGSIVAEVFRCDRDKTVRVSCWSNSVTDDVLAWLLPYSAEQLSCFENGAPLPGINTWPIYRDLNTNA
jgi:hypothetical protein